MAFCGAPINPPASCLERCCRRFYRRQRSPFSHKSYLCGVIPKSGMAQPAPSENGPSAHPLKTTSINNCGNHPIPLKQRRPMPTKTGIGASRNALYDNPLPPKGIFIVFCILQRPVLTKAHFFKSPYTAFYSSANHRISYIFVAILPAEHG